MKAEIMYSPLLPKSSLKPCLIQTGAWIFQKYDNFYMGHYHTVCDLQMVSNWQINSFGCKTACPKCYTCPQATFCAMVRKCISYDIAILLIVVVSTEIDRVLLELTVEDTCLWTKIIYFSQRWHLQNFFLFKGDHKYHLPFSPDHQISSSTLRSDQELMSEVILSFSNHIYLSMI